MVKNPFISLSTYVCLFSLSTYVVSLKQNDHDFAIKWRIVLKTEDRCAKMEECLKQKAFADKIYNMGNFLLSGHEIDIYNHGPNFIKKISSFRYFKGLFWLQKTYATPLSLLYQPNQLSSFILRNSVRNPTGNHSIKITYLYRISYQ